MRTSILLVIALGLPGAWARNSLSLPKPSLSYELYARSWHVLVPGVMVSTAGTVIGTFATIAGSGLSSAAPLFSTWVGSGLLLGSVACTATHSLHYGPTFSDRYLNCVNQPLAWFNANPRDRMYVKDFVSCAPDLLVVRLGSESGHFERRQFLTEDHRLKAIRMIDEDSSGIALGTTIELAVDAQAGVIQTGHATYQGRLRAALLPVQLRGLDPLITDYAAYVDLCARPDAHGDHHPRAFDAHTPRQLHRDAL